MATDWNSTTPEKDLWDVFSSLKLILLIIALFQLSALTSHVKRGNELTKDLVVAVVAISIWSRDNLLYLSLQELDSAVYLYIIATTLTQLLLARFMERKATMPTIQTTCRPITMPSLPPMLFPCRTTHTRLFPTHHSFSYSYLFVGVPVERTGSVGSGLSTGSASPSTAFHVHQEDYLARGRHPGRLKGKLDEYLLSQNVDLSSYSCAYLVTAPRFLGFSFNPVSFWYLYDEDMLLKYMILEVNNTFDERRIYFLQRDSDKSRDRFKQEWKKDFHVSPFNDREGSYSLSAVDPFAMPGVPTVDNNVVLKSADGKPKIVARVFSTEKGINASSLSKLRTILFAFKWWWVGFMTNPRILREARILWVKKVQLFYRPEIRVGSISRNETPEEAIFEKAFREYLQEMANAFRCCITYTPAAGVDRGKKVELLNQPGCEKRLELEVLTPAFYSELARCSRLDFVLKERCLDAKDGEQMVYFTQTQLLLVQDSIGELTKRLLGRGRDVKPGMSFRRALNHHLRTGSSIISAFYQTTRARFYLGKGTRQERGEILERRIALAGHESGSSEYKASFADVMPTLYNENEELAQFEKAATSILLADRLAFGSTAVLRFYRRLIRWMLVGLVAWQISCLATYREDLTLYGVASMATKMLLIGWSSN